MKRPAHIMRSILLGRQLLSSAETERLAYLIQLSIPDPQCVFEPGDIVYIYPKNDVRFVDRLLDSVAFSGTEPINVEGEEGASIEISLREALTSYVELIFKTRVLASLDTKDPVDFWTALALFKQHQGEALSPQILYESLKPLRPRAYSIASAQQQNPSVMELIVGLVTFKDVMGGICEGLSSGFLCKRLQINETVETYIKVSHFKLPTDPYKPIIMVGPGTGIAPFKAFLEARCLEKGQGKNWLFFGGRNYQHDFLLKDFLLKCQQEGSLDRLDLAFSRDQAHKIYVQHKMLEQATRLWSWLQEGAYFYICGDAKAMAKDVENTLLAIISQCGAMDNTQAKAYLQDLKCAGRYQKDVY